MRVQFIDGWFHLITKRLVSGRWLLVLDDDVVGVEQSLLGVEQLWWPKQAGANFLILGHSFLRVTMLLSLSGGGVAMHSKSKGAAAMTNVCFRG